MGTSLDIDELAWKHVNRHPNDKSEYCLSVMRGRWGRHATDKAIKRAEDVRAMVDPEFANQLKWRRLKSATMGAQHYGIKGLKLTSVIVDDVTF